MVVASRWRSHWPERVGRWAVSNLDSQVSDFPLEIGPRGVHYLHRRGTCPCRFWQVGQRSWRGTTPVPAGSAREGMRERAVLQFRMRVLSQPDGASVDGELHLDTANDAVGFPSVLPNPVRVSPHPLRRHSDGSRRWHHPAPGSTGRRGPVPGPRRPSLFDPTTCTAHTQACPMTTKETR